MAKGAAAAYIRCMPPRRPSKKDTPKKLAGRMKRRWRVVLLRNKGEILGEVEAADVASAKAAAADQFELDEFQRNRIIVQEAESNPCVHTAYGERSNCSDAQPLDGTNAPAVTLAVVRRDACNARLRSLRPTWRTAIPRSA